MAASQGPDSGASRQARLIPVPPAPPVEVVPPAAATELEQELQRAAEEIERGECSVLSIDDVARWAETGVPPWPDDFRG